VGSLTGAVASIVGQCRGNPASKPGCMLESPSLMGSIASRDPERVKDPTVGGVILPENLVGADNQQGSPRRRTPQRLHAGHPTSVGW